MDFYKIHRVLYDVTIPSMSAGLLELDDTMSYAGTSYRTTRQTVPLTSDISGTYVGEIDSIEIIPPLGTNGAPLYTGTTLYFVVDGQNQRHYVEIPVDGQLLSWPLHTRVYGGSHLARLLGEPFWRLCQRGLAGHTVSAMPLRNTTIKYSQGFGVSILSANGWTSSQVSNGGLRIIVKGYIYQQSDLAYLSRGWQSSITYQTTERDITGAPELNTEFGVAGSDISFATWTQLPGGVGQGTLKVNPYLHVAINAIATDSNSFFALSNSSNLFGGSGHVQNEYQDLGVPTNVALLVKSYGVSILTRPSNIGRFGWVIDGTEIPENPNSSQGGIGVSDNVNDYYFGDVGPYIGDLGTGTGYANLYRPIPHPDGEPLLLYRNRAAPFIAGNGTPVPANAVAFGLYGAIVEGV